MQARIREIEGYPVQLTPSSEPAPARSEHRLSRLSGTAQVAATSTKPCSHVTPACRTHGEVSAPNPVAGGKPEQTYSSHVVLQGVSKMGIS